MQSSIIQRGVLGLTALAVQGSVWANSLVEYEGRSQLNLRQGVTEVSQEIFSLHMAIMWICVAIGALVFALMFYSMLKHRKSKGYKAATFHESTALEVFWTVIPFIIVIWMAVMATKTLVKTYDTSDAELTVKVTASQWKWHYEYLSYGDDKDVGVGFMSVLATPRDQIDAPRDAARGEHYLQEVDNHLVIPAGKKVRFLITSDDVIHAFWVPDFGIKKDAIPGFINELWTRVPEDKTGTYRGFCAELCGKDHAFMPIVVDVIPQTEFDSWISEKKAAAAAGPDLTGFASLADAMKEGEAVYNKSCAGCHQVNGTGAGPFPALAGSAIAIEKDKIGEHISIVKNGKNMMPPFGGLSPRDLAAVVTYERNAWGNNTGDLVQPADVAK